MTPNNAINADGEKRRAFVAPPVMANVEAVEKPPSEHLFAQSIGSNYVQDRNKNAERNAPEPVCQAFARIVEICRHDNSFIAVCRFW